MDQDKKTDIFCILSIIFGILIPPVGIVLGIIGLKRVNKNSFLSGRVQAITGIIIGILLTVVPLIVVISFTNYANQNLIIKNPINNGCYLEDIQGVVCQNPKFVDNNHLEFTLKNSKGQNSVNSITLKVEKECDPSSVNLEIGKSITFLCEITKKSNSYENEIHANYEINGLQDEAKGKVRITEG